MKKKSWVFLLFISLVILGFFSVFIVDQSKKLNILTAASLKDVMLEIQKNYLVIQPHVKLNFKLGASGALQKQIEQGKPADLFISAALNQMEDLKKKDLLVKGTLKIIMKNQLVMIVPKNSTLNLKGFKDLALDSIKKVGIGDPESVPAGQYALQVFKYLGITRELQGKMVLGADVRKVLTYVETAKVDVGIVYQTDALISNKVKIVATAPVGSHVPIVYPAAILVCATHPKEAADFLAYLAGSESKTVFKKYGFIVSK